MVIDGAAGGVGTLAVQLARHRGVNVIGTASEHNHTYLRSLGAIPVHFGDGLADRIRAVGPGGIDAALDAAGHGSLPALVDLVGSGAPVGLVKWGAFSGACGIYAIRANPRMPAARPDKNPVMSPLTRVATLVAAVAVAAWAGLEATGSAARHVGQAATARANPASAAPARLYLHVPSRIAPDPAPPAPPVIDPGTLPQTRALPSSSDPQFQDRLKALWQGILDDSPQEAHPFFFPKTAYIQLKALWNAGGDYDHRLLGYFDLDVHAAHRLLGAGAQRARLVGIDVPTADAEWMPPGSEENKISYYRLYGTRVRYTLDGQQHSFGIFSLLSWRGQWYAIHFGPWPRWERYGDVLQPR